mgnify:FL=1
MKINSVGFGYSKSIQLSDGLIGTGIVLVIAGLVISHTKSQWYATKDQTTLDIFTKLYNSCANNVTD